ncbi:MAG: sulfite exporter TauE/SafE family protein [Pseudomonadota bacterium]
MAALPALGASAGQGLAIILILMCIGALAGFAGGLFGIGGGIIMVPALFFYFETQAIAPHLIMPSAVATSLAVIIVTACRALQTHHGAGAVDWPVLRRWFGWIGVGAFAAGQVAPLLPQRWLLLIFAAGAFALGVVRIAKLFRRAPGRGSKTETMAGIERAHERAEPLTPVIAIVTGLVSGVLGIGGGAIGVMALTAAKMPIHRAVGTASGFGIAVAVPGTLAFVWSGLADAGVTMGQLPAGSLGFVNLPAALVMAGLSVVTAPMGARCGQYLSPRWLSGLFGFYIIAMAILMISRA